MVSHFYQNKRIFVTGHTGFKGSWLCLWLSKMGAKICGYALEPEANPDSLYNLCRISHSVDSRIGDIRDYAKLYNAIHDFKPEIVFHMAAQSLVLRSYESPVDTYSTNVMGTVHLLEAVRKIGCIKTIVNVTTDKCYENNETGLPFCESDPLGGHDPYSSSKAAAEIVSLGYRRSFLASSGINMATVRAGNVIGGGDFSNDRLIPDIIRATKNNQPVNIRQPSSVRPWQHVLDVLRGYLMLGEKLHEKGEAYAEAFNFGPDKSNVTVGRLADMFAESMKNPPVITKNEVPQNHEAKLLNIDNSKSKNILGWQPLFATEKAIRNTAEWYSNYLIDPDNAYQFTLNQLDEYIKII